MCKVIINESESSDFILYNTIFSEYNRHFTVDKIEEQLTKQNITNIHKKDIKSYIRDMVNSGLIKDNFDYYVVDDFLM